MVDRSKGACVSGNSIYRFKNAAVLTVAAVDAPEVVPSSYFDDELEGTLDRLGAPLAAVGTSARMALPTAALFPAALAAHLAAPTICPMTPGAAAWATSTLAIQPTTAS